MSKNYFHLLESCTLCPRNCGANRLKGEKGYCRSGFLPKIALASLHFWEEPCISGQNGSGTLFFSNCTLSCVFCQNHEISQEGRGEEVSLERLAEIFLEQQERKAHNINLVTPSHFAPQIQSALVQAKKRGLVIPVVYNTNSYENLETLKLFEGLVDIYLPDVKYFDDFYAVKYSRSSSYFENAFKAVREMVRQTGNPVFDQQGMILKGTIIRHLVLPGLLEDSKKLIRILYENFGSQVYFSLMNQFTPVYQCSSYPELQNSISAGDYDELVDYAVDLGIENGFIQEEGTQSKEYIPDFNLKGI